MAMASAGQAEGKQRVEGPRNAGPRRWRFVLSGVGPPLLEYRRGWSEEHRVHTMVWGLDPAMRNRLILALALAVAMLSRQSGGICGDPPQGDPPGPPANSSGSRELVPVPTLGGVQFWADELFSARA